MAKKVPIIKAKAAKQRLLFAKEYKEVSPACLEHVIFSDESSIQRGHGSRQEYALKKGKIQAGRGMISEANRSNFYPFPNKLFYLVFKSL